MRTAAGLFLLLAAAVSSGQARGSASAIAESTTAYHSDAMGFDFFYPSGFVNKGPGPNDKKGTDSCVTFPITAMDMRKAFNMIFLRRTDTACLGSETTASDRGISVVNFLTYLLRQFGKPTMSSSTNYDIGSHMGSTVSGSVKVQGDAANTMIYGAATCLLADKNIACFAFLSSDCLTLASLSASTVKFTDTAAAPVIPSRLSTACKLGS